MAKTLKEHNFFGFDATVVADSINGELQKEGIICRGTTMVVTFPRIVLAEFNTHRMFNRNSASSRAIPFKKMIERVQQNPFVPVAFQKEHKGMQGTIYHEGRDAEFFINEWLNAADDAMQRAERMSDNGITKQLANRLLEPFLWHTVIVSATEWENFFELRCPQYSNDDGTVYYRSIKDLQKNTRTNVTDWDIISKFKINKSHADIHIQLVAEAMWDAYNESTPKILKGGEWHVPFHNEIGDLPTDLVKDEQEISTGLIQTIQDIERKISVATCGCISFGNIAPDNSKYDKDIEMYEKLKTNHHASPFEHVFQAMTEEQYFNHFKGIKNEDAFYFEGDPDFNKFGWSHNLHGFISERTKLGI